MSWPSNRHAVLAALALAAPLGVSGAQDAGRTTEFLYGHWNAAGGGTSYEFRTNAPFTGNLSHGFGAAILIDDSLGRRRAFYGLGYELQIARPALGLAPYALAGLELGLLTDTATQHLGAQWSAGAGLEWRPLRFAALAIEGRFRMLDEGPRGFWRPGAPRKGLSLAAGFSLRWGGGGGRGGAGGGLGSPGTGGTPRTSVPASVPERISGGAADVVRTALDALGTPYQWGGTKENGFDCSGLVQYAYARYGIRLPRMSRDQARAGQEVPPAVEALQPGDILLFAARPGGGVTHVGMYVGEGKFIHSSSTGVKLSFLDVHDVEGNYWMPRWVGARRVMP